MLELADEEDSKSFAGDSVWVRVPPPAPNQYNPNQIFLIGDGFGLFVFFEKFEDTHFRNGVVKRRPPRFLADKEGRHSLCLPACMDSEISLTA